MAASVFCAAQVSCTAAPSAREDQDAVTGGAATQGGQTAGARTDAQGGALAEVPSRGGSHSSGGGAQGSGTAGGGRPGKEAQGGRPSGGSESGSSTGGSGTGGGDETGGRGETGGSCGTDDCCPDDPDKVVPGACGCGSPDTDSDSDGKLDCADTCPSNPTKVVEGQCGCDTDDVDTDGDTVADCKDVCPADPEKTTSPGDCGCGRPDVDTDRDGALDCVDECPRDPALQVAQVCGCTTRILRLCLAHRYSFNDPKGSLTVADSVAGAKGDAIRVTLPGDGTVVLGGAASDQYIQLPSGIVSSLGDSVTVEAWVRWDGEGGEWQRLFDFGDNDAAAAGQQGTGITYFFMTPASSNDRLLTALATSGRSNERVAEAPSPLPSDPDAFQHIAAVVDGKARTLSLYLNGALQTTSSLNELRLSSLKDVNNWIGRSQFASDPEFGGTITEFRIYSAARRASQVSASAVAGPDGLPAD